jgi:uncharacterized damage-inducible protein DinB
MALVSSVLQEYEQEVPTTRRVLERVPLERADWKPHPKSMSLGRLAAWMAGAPGWVAKLIPADGFDAATFELLPVPASSRELLATFDAGVKAARQAAERLGDEAAKGDWSFRMQEQKLLTLPRVGILRLFLLSDAIHHRGQMTVYLRLLDVSVPSIYGPSADENPYR